MLFLKAKEMIFCRTNSVNWELSILEHIWRMLVVNCGWIKAPGNRDQWVFGSHASGENGPPFPSLSGLLGSQPAGSCRSSLSSDKRKQVGEKHKKRKENHWLATSIHVLCPCFTYSITIIKQKKKKKVNRGSSSWARAFHVRCFRDVLHRCSDAMEGWAEMPWWYF